MTPNIAERDLPPVNPPPQVDPPAKETPKEEPPYFKPLFAAVSGIVLTVLGFVLLWHPTRAAWDVTKSDWLGDKGDEALAASLSVPLTVLGAALILIGTWMAVVEWRGRFKKDDKAPEGVGRGGAFDAGAIIESVGKLRGAALVLVVGAALMLAAAWVASSAAGSQSSPSGATGASGASGP